MSSLGHYGDGRGMGGSDFPELPRTQEEIDSEQPFAKGTKFKLNKLTPIEGWAIKTSVEEKPEEYKQITPESLKGGFKAASDKACMDLIPVNIFELAVNRILKSQEEAKPFTSLASALTNFWRGGFVNDTLDRQLDYLYRAFDESFKLLSENTGSEIKALFALGELFAIGKKKYAARNWEKGIDWGIVYSAAWRHLLHHLEGEDKDPIDGQLHLTSIVWNIVALIHYVEHPDKYVEFDTRKVIERANERGQK